MSEFFNNIPKIAYEGKDSKNPLAFKFYNPDEVIAGKTMREQLKFALSWWHTMGGDGTDMFGCGTTNKTWGCDDVTARAKAKVEAAFEIMDKLSIDYYCFHDRDLSPEYGSLGETNEKLRAIVDLCKEKQDATGKKLLWGTAKCFDHPRYMHGAGTSPSADVFAYAAAQIKSAIDATVKLGGQGYVFWGGREGYETLLNTNMGLELDNMARLMHLAVDYARSIGFTGDFYVEPKPKEPTKHQYDFDSATVIGFLQKYGLDKDFKLNIEENVYSDIETKLITAATSEDYSTLPDIFLMQDYSYHKMIANFPGIYTELTDSGLDWDQFSGGKLADSTVDGHHYGLPFDNGASVMAVRSDMIENAGLTVDDFKDLTWSEFEEKAQKVVDANGVPMLTSSGGSELIIEMMQSAGASPVVDGEVKIADNAALKESLTVYKDMVDKGILAEYTDWDQYIASMNDGKAAGVINGCWIMSSVQAAEDQSGKWAIVDMPKLDGIDGATNYANCGGASWAVSSNCKNTELAFDFLKSTFGSSVELYDDLLPNAGAISSYLPAAESDVYNQPSEFYGGQTVYKDIVEFAGKVPAFDCGAYYSDVRSALTDAVTNIVQNNADIDSEMQNAQDTVEFNIAG